MEENANARDPIVASVLLVDDEPRNLLALEAVLAPIPHLRLVRALSGREALERLSSEDFAVILLDVHMPGLDGFETAALIRKHERNAKTPIVFMTAVYRDEAFALRGYTHGAVDYLEKPFLPEVLRAKVAVFVDLFAERERLKAQAEALRERERFIGVLGHDLRLPLSAITMSTGALTRRGELAPSSLNIVARIERSARRMARMVGDLLGLTQSREGGGIPISPQPVDLGDVCRRVVAEEVEVTHPDREVLLAVDGDTRGTWDEGRVEQVLTNLISNALAYGRASAPVRVAVRDRGSAVALEVTNQGEPIPAELVPHLFDPFQRGKAAHKRAGGLGLGLYIVEQIARAHGGRVEVASTAEDGTTFRVHWPRLAPRVDGQQSDEAASALNRA